MISLSYLRIRSFLGHTLSVNIVLVIIRSIASLPKYPFSGKRVILDVINIPRVSEVACMSKR